MKPINKHQRISNITVAVNPNQASLKHDPSARKRYLRQTMFQSLIQWEALSPKRTFPSAFADKPMMTMRFKKPKLKQRKPAETQTYPRAVKPDDFLDMIHQHKWIESEKQGRDIGMEAAMLDWLDHFKNKIRVHF